MNQSLILILLLVTCSLVHCQEDAVAGSESTTTGQPTTSEATTTKEPMATSEEPVSGEGSEEMNDGSGSGPFGERSIGSDLMSTLTGFLPSFPSLSSVGSGSLPCLGLSSMTSGRCVSPLSCELSGGSEDKGCLTGVDVCCIPSSKCGSVIKSLDTWISNDEYPNATSNNPKSCVYTINKASTLISQIRIEIHSLQLDSSTNCEQDKLLIDDLSGITLFPICGQTSGTHLIIPFSSDSLTLRVITGERPTGNQEHSNLATQTPRKWRMRVTQFANNGPDVAPAGCTQLYSADGTLRSLGQGMGSTGQKYAICFQKRTGMCGIKFDMSSFHQKGSVTPVETDRPVEGTQPPVEHQQRMDQLPLEPQPIESNLENGRPISKRQVLSGIDLSVNTPLGNLGIDKNLQISGSGLPVLEKAAPPPKPEPYYNRPYGNSIYHQPAQHAQQLKPQVQPWQHAHMPVHGHQYAPAPAPKPGYGHQYAPAPNPAYGHQYAPAPVPKPAVTEVLAPVQEPIVKEVLSKPVGKVDQEVVQKTLVAETNLLGLVGLNNSATLQVPKGIAESVFNPLTVPGLALLETPKVIVADNSIEKGTIQGVQVGSNPGIVVSRSKRESNLPCTTSLFIPPTSSNNGQLLCLQSLKYTGPQYLIMKGHPLVAFVESTPSDSILDWNIPFSYIPC